MVVPEEMCAGVEEFLGDDLAADAKRMGKDHTKLREAVIPLPPSIEVMGGDQHESDGDQAEEVDEGCEAEKLIDVPESKRLPHPGDPRRRRLKSMRPKDTSGIGPGVGTA